MKNDVKRKMALLIREKHALKSPRGMIALRSRWSSALWIEFVERGYDG